MEGLYALSLWCLSASLVFGTRMSTTSFFFDQPLLSSFFLLVSCGVTTAGLGHWLKRHDLSSSSVDKYEAVPLQDVGAPHGSRDPSPMPHARPVYPSGLRQVRVYFLALVIILCFRVEVFRRSIDRVQCNNIGYDAFIPFALALIDWWSSRQHQPQLGTIEDPHMGLYDLIEQRLTRSRYSSLLLTFAFSVTSAVALSADSSPRSTYICSTTPLDQHAPVFQFLGSLLNVLAIWCVGELLQINEGRSGPRPFGLRISTVAYAMIFTSLIVFFPMAVFNNFNPDVRLLFREIPGLLFWSIIKTDFFICLSVICSLLMIYHYGSTTTGLLVTFGVTATKTTVYAWNNIHPFPPLSAGYGFLSITVTTIVLITYFKIDAAHDRTEFDKGRQVLFKRVPKTVYLLSVAFIILRFSLWFATTKGVTFHPIDMLIWNAEIKHNEFLNTSSPSSSLQDAHQEYSRRYLRQPPAGFDKWYSYATSLSSRIIDDFDSIERDLQPFFSVSPQEIRERTWRLLADDFNDVAGVSIRDGKAIVMDNVRPTHRWMMEGVAEMIKPFGEYLPDMDLAFNINDEPRVVVPYETIQSMKGSSLKPKETGHVSAGFSKDRASQWKPMPEASMALSTLDEQSWKRVFYHSGNRGCYPGSPARSQRLWDVGRFCSACTYPHSLGGFLRDWKTAGDICYQPDLADMHGFYTSPAAYKVASKLEPIFSQSKSHGFNDILYPSAWNYMDKVKYDPPLDSPDPLFTEKNTTLFWRGATSEGISFGDGKWRGMSRQRFVHMANNPGNSAPYESLLVPYSEAKQNATGHMYHYENVQARELTRLLPTNMHIVDRIWKCDHRDCTNQETDFAPMFPPSDFQEHWKYKYLLDLDGAGFSGRFLPFLHSRSLPFKSALFREWWDDRLTPWQHFVPLDLRGQGFWATLAYFTGLDGSVNGRHVKMDAHEWQAERIAEQGREWAGQVLRKEDMEIYFFRLLLEWGRLTDDNRDNIGLA
ncbi:glycosyltransferase family 90 protein [Polychaeton citri CBS 116435]|uniref:Glycosyltransferase family 90 protein n=1 Tax=Polychaeton citri CBS 116435 TaxID=1314669 RepID=A0A9P4US44_9PEZI|nr:glycosyltransferase family 90 protein [Polychaeton citri CBS 116435]